MTVLSFLLCFIPPSVSTCINFIRDCQILSHCSSLHHQLLSTPTQTSLTHAVEMIRFHCHYTAIAIRVVARNVLKEGADQALDTHSLP